MAAAPNQPAATAPVSPPAKPPRRSFRSWFWGSILGALLLIGLYTAFMLWWSYSEGERAGVLQKFSKRGWICKTHEGELAMYVVGGVAPQIWNFSVRDPVLAEETAPGGRAAGAPALLRASGTAHELLRRDRLLRGPLRDHERSGAGGAVVGTRHCTSSTLTQAEYCPDSVRVPQVTIPDDRPSDWLLEPPISIHSPSRPLTVVVVEAVATGG